MPIFSLGADHDIATDQGIETALRDRERENFVRLLYLGQFPEAGAAAVYAASMAGILGWHNPLKWLAVAYIFMALRFLALTSLLAKSDQRNAPMHYVLFTEFLTGICWGASVFYFTQTDSLPALYTSIIWLVGMIVSALGLTTVNSNYPAFWTSPITVLLMGKLVFSGRQTLVLSAVGLVFLILFFGAIAYFARSISRRDFYREMQNASLVEQLSAANTYANKLNKALRSEIIRREKIENMLRKERDLAEHRSTTDSLTGIRNRRAFDSALRNELARARRNQHVLSLILIDVDRFKNYNDARGHQAGDDVLREVARIIEQSIRRGTDMSCRYGGEEFAVLLPNTNIEDASRIAETIRKQLEARGITHPDSDVGAYVTVSLGVAAIAPTENDTGEVLLNVADQALYQAKSAGRNQARKIH